VAKDPAVAVIDIGSNSIKVLVAQRGDAATVSALHFRTIDARIGTGLGAVMPRLSEDGMARAVSAIQSLLADATQFSVSRVLLVATSAVRDAQNGAEFRQRVHVATGHEVRVLSGNEEANLIGRGLTCDPALRDLQDFYVFDLGGGSLECLAFRQRRIEQAVSLPLGCVRLTGRFVTDSGQPLAEAAAKAIAQHTRETIARSEFRFSLPAVTPAVGTGGTVATVRAIHGARRSQTVEQTDPVVGVAELKSLLAELGSKALADRREVPGLPPARADIFPTALATLIEIAAVGGFSSYRNSFHNLRYGVAAEALAEL
jgi:exopolyphosphatase/guanosine-5'-triphosphate,3'-diphosphate pyrophosphatase